MNIIIAGVSGSGKTTLLNEFKDDNRFIIHQKHSDRTIRNSEKAENTEIKLISTNEFNLNKEKKKYDITYKKFKHNYGILKSINKKAKHKDLIQLIIIRDLKYVNEFCKLYPETKFVYIEANEEITRRRLRRRGSTSRLNTIDKEFIYYNNIYYKYDKIIVNNASILDMKNQLINYLEGLEWLKK